MVVVEQPYKKWSSKPRDIYHLYTTCIYIYIHIANWVMKNITDPTYFPGTGRKQPLNVQRLQVKHPQSSTENHLPRLSYLVFGQFLWVENVYGHSIYVYGIFTLRTFGGFLMVKYGKYMASIPYMDAMGFGICYPSG